MIRAFLKTKIGLSLIIALLFVLGALILKISLTPDPADEISQKVNLIADASIKKAIKDGSYQFEDALNLLSSTSLAMNSSNNGSTSTQSSIPTTITATDRFARELFSQYAEAKKGGQEIDAATQAKIAEMVLSNDYSDPVELITESDVRTSNSMTRTQIKAYGNTLGKILGVPPVKGEQELVILERARDTGLTRADIDVLDLIYKRYVDMSKALMAVTVPSDAVSAHIALINGINLVAGGVEGILTLTTDPVGALTKIKYYENGVDLVSAGAIKMKAYFKTEDISFSSTESGYKITQ